MERKPDENEKINEIEKAYQDLMNKYLCILSKTRGPPLSPMTKSYFIETISIFLPKIIRWRIRKHLIKVREKFLLLVAQSRNHIPLDTIERFERYNEDMDKVIVQVGMSGLSALFLSIIPAIPLLIELIRILTPQEYHLFSRVLDGWFWVMYIVLYIGYFAIFHYMGYRNAIRMLVSEERALSTLISDYVAPSDNQ